MTDAAFLTTALESAQAAGHIFPDWAACEAAHASKFGTIEAAVKGNNLFDFRVPAKRGPGTLTIPIEHASKLVMRLRFASWEECFRYRAVWIQQMTMFYLVRRAKTGEQYIAEMNKLASRPDTYQAEVKAIYTANEALFHEEAKAKAQAVDSIFRRIGMKARLQIIVIALLAIASMLGAQTVSNQYKHINVTWVESYQACNFTAPTPINTSCINGYQITFTPPSGAGANASTVPACTATVTTGCVGPGNSYSWTPGGFLYAGTWGVSIILQYLDNNGLQQQLSGVATSVVVPLPFVPPGPITGLTAVPAP